MSNIRVAINGFGRIGRLTFRTLLEKPGVEVISINDLTSVATLAHLLKYDSVHGRFNGSVSVEADSLVVNGKKIQVTAEKDPKNLPHKANNIDVVLESTGRFTDDQSAGLHLQAGARKVIISAPAKGNVPTIVLGVNEHTLNGSETILSNASCTTNCLAPMAKILEETFGIEKGYMTTIHAYTQDQLLQDGPHADLRRARGAAVNIVPTSTGAAKAIGLVLPQLKGKLDGVSMRVPVPDGSLTDLTVILKRETTRDEINAAFKQAAAGPMANYLEYTDEPIVSSDIVGNPHSCIFDSEQTLANGNLVKVVGWYDNEFGYSSRTADLIVIVGQN